MDPRFCFLFVIEIRFLIPILRRWRSAVQGQPDLQRKLHKSQGYTENPAPPKGGGESPQQVDQDSLKITTVFYCFNLVTNSEITIVKHQA